MSFLDDLFVRSALAAVGVALAAAPLGCFVVWRRMAYFGDATAHAAILGVALALAMQLPVFAGVIFVAGAIAVAVWWVSGRQIATDTALGVISYSALATGLVAISFVDGVRIDLNAFLFGDVLAVGRDDLALIWIGAGLIVGLVIWRWSALLAATLSPELARASGINPQRETLALTLLIALAVAVAIKVVGALLIGAMLIIPAAAARPLVGTPERMALLASGLGVLAAVGGLQAAFTFDTPAGPTIVCIAALIFIATSVVSVLRR